VLRASDATRARGAAARCSPARSGFRLARQLLQPRRRHRRLRSPWTPRRPQPTRPRRRRAAGSVRGPWAAAPRLGRGPGACAGTGTGSSRQRIPGAPRTRARGAVARCSPARSGFRLARGSPANRLMQRGSELQWRWPRRRAGVATAAPTPPSSAEERQGAEPGGNQAVASPYHPLGSARRARGVSVAWGPGGGMPRPSI
jgi:hypothetical protein